jgi:hypothetical protein
MILLLDFNEMELIKNRVLFFYINREEGKTSGARELFTPV